MSERLLLTVTEATGLIAGRTTVVRKWLRDQQLVRMFPGLGERVRRSELEARIEALSPSVPAAKPTRRAAERRPGDLL